MTDQIELPETPSHIVFRQVPTDAILEACKNPELNLSRMFLDDAIERGDQLFGAFDHDHLVSYLWRTKTAAPHTRRLGVSVEPPYCYAYNSFTLPAYRGKRISPAVHLFSDKVMAQQGFTHRTGFVLVTNLASIAMGKRMGSQPIGYAGYYTCCGRFHHFRTKAVRDIGFRFFELAR